MIAKYAENCYSDLYQSFLVRWSLISQYFNLKVTGRMRVTSPLDVTTA